MRRGVAVKSLLLRNRGLVSITVVPTHGIHAQRIQKDVLTKKLEPIVTAD